MLTGPGPGRGAWICAGDVRCLDLAVRRRAIQPALRAPVVATAVGLLRMEVAGRASMEGPPESETRG